MKTLLKWLFTLSLAVFTFFFGLFVFTKIWTLIAVPMGAPQITKWQAYGVAVLVGHFIVPSLSMYAKEKSTAVGPDRIIKFCLNNIGCHLSGWLIAYLMFG